MIVLAAVLLVALAATYLWSLFNLPVLAVGVRNLRRAKQKFKKPTFKTGEAPTFSIIVPVKNEDKVIGRLLEALAKIRYPRDKKEIVIIEDGSNDGTVSSCEEFILKHKKLAIKILRKPSSEGKPSALNYAIRHCTMDIIAFFDADNVPAPNVLANVAKYFDDSSVAAVQGRTMTINSEENMLTKLLSYEDSIWCEAYLRGKDALNLFVHLRGSCQFIRRSVLENIAGFDEHTVSEDMEISARLTEKGYRIRYAPDVQSWQEVPSRLGQLFGQRTRWFRGTMEVALKYGRLMAKPNVRRFDAEATIFAPFILLASLLMYFTTVWTFMAPFSLDFWWQTALQCTTLLILATLFLCGLCLIYTSKPRKASNLLWLPFIYFYWTLQTFIALYAFILILLRRPRKWSKTEKTGAVKIPIGPMVGKVGRQ